MITIYNNETDSVIEPSDIETSMVLYLGDSKEDAFTVHRFVDNSIKNQTQILLEGTGLVLLLDHCSLEAYPYKVTARGRLI